MVVDLCSIFVFAKIEKSGWQFVVCCLLQWKGIVEVGGRVGGELCLARLLNGCLGVLRGEDCFSFNLFCFFFIFYLFFF